MIEKAVRLNEGKPKYSLIDYSSLEPLVRVLMFGEGKYNRNNWRKPQSKLEILDSLQRHVGELIDNVNEGKEEMDVETQLHIIGHIMANCMFFAYHDRNKTFIEYLTKTNK